MNNKYYQSSPSIDDYRSMPPDPGRIEGGLKIQGSFSRKSDHDTPLISIVTIIFNGEKTLEQTIQSVLNQTYNNIEYIIVDGGSTDGTIDILRKYDNKIAYWMSEPDKGIGDAFNKGITTSTGEIIGLINADDWYSAKGVETVMNEYLKKGQHIYHAKLQYWNSDMKPYYVFSGDDEKILKRGTINHPTVFVPKKIYEEIGLFNINFKNAVDYEWLIRAKLKGIKFHYIDQVIANMRLEGNSDIKWFNNYIEIFRARKIHGMNAITNLYLFFESTIITVIRKFIESLGLHNIVRFYRKHFSISKKEAS